MFVGSLLFAGLSMLCKEPGITVLGVNLLYDVVVVNRRVIDRYVYMIGVEILS